MTEADWLACVDHQLMLEFLPVLGNALEEAACHDKAILGHLRGPGPHCR